MPPSASMSSLPTYTLADLAAHPTWLIIDNTVYDISPILDTHPGGPAVLRQSSGRDATSAFYNLHRHSVLTRYAHLAVGTLHNTTPSIIPPSPGDLSPVPYAEPWWLASPPLRPSPYYNASHARLRRAARLFVDEHLTPEALECEESGRFVSDDLVRRMEHNGILRMRLGPGPHLHGHTLLDGAVQGDQFDYFHMLVLAQELARTMTRGFQDGNMAGLTIGLAPVLNWMAPSDLKEQVCEDVLAGRDKICLAITEAFAGSDVAGIQTTADKTPDGEFFILNGSKKWITNGMFATYFVTLARTGPSFTVLLVPRSPGLSTSPIKTSYSSSAGTALVTFDNVRVPVSHVVGPEVAGLRVVFANFNHERWAMVCTVVSQCRMVLEESLKWANQRTIGDGHLIDQPVIRQKLATMMTLTEGNQSWLESITHQMCTAQTDHLAGPIALLKVSATRAAQGVADAAVAVWGGRALTQTGMGARIEAFVRTYRFDGVLGGAEDVVADLGVRQAVRGFPRAML